MNQTILITGASSGIGKATARHFQSRGWNVIATLRTPALETELNRLDRVLVTRLDVLDTASITAAVEAGLSRFGQIDVLLNNAGYGAYGPLEATPLEKIRRQFDVNVIGLLATTQALLPHFRARRRGVIVNMSSIGGKITFPLGTLYHGSKFAVEGLSEALHYELAALGVRMKIVEPGMVRTDFAGRSFDFSHDEALVEYQPVVQALLSALGPMADGASAPEGVAEVIYRAATDGTDQLRYEAGADAEQLLAGRRKLDDASFLAGIRAQFGLGASR
ncbi:MAG: SDR family oxidoreductase [Rhodoferax sp.]|nr:SDR family oxidoreductase [Rhodoferax sp.]